MQRKARDDKKRLLNVHAGEKTCLSIKLAALWAAFFHCVSMIPVAFKILRPLGSQFFSCEYIVLNIACQGIAVAFPILRPLGSHLFFHVSIWSNILRVNELQLSFQFCGPLGRNFFFCVSIWSHFTWLIQGFVPKTQSMKRPNKTRNHLKKGQTNDNVPSGVHAFLLNHR